MVCIAIAVGGCGKQQLAAQVDELLRAGRTLEARQKLATELPALIRQGEYSQADDVARVLEQRLPSLPVEEASDVRQTAVSQYFDSSGIGDLPWDDICEASVRSAPQLQYDSLDELLQEQERRENLTNFCQLLGLDF